jgi:hypothetical protein
MARSAAKRNWLGCFELDLSGCHRRPQVINDFAQILNQFDILIVGIVGETLIGAADSIHSASFRWSLKARSSVALA